MSLTLLEDVDMMMVWKQGTEYALERGQVPPSFATGGGPRGTPGTNQHGGRGSGKDSRGTVQRPVKPGQPWRSPSKLTTNPPD